MVKVTNLDGTVTDFPRASWFRVSLEGVLLMFSDQIPGSREQVLNEYSIAAVARNEWNKVEVAEETKEK
jgi:hypothetical protein